LKEKSLESFDFLASHEVVKWFRLESLEDFPSLGYPNTNLLKSITTRKKELPSLRRPQRKHQRLA
jgi:hypothetical protein